jgi:hypothetical protein
METFFIRFSRRSEAGFFMDVAQRLGVRCKNAPFDAASLQERIEEGA